MVSQSATKAFSQLSAWDMCPWSLDFAMLGLLHRIGNLGWRAYGLLLVGVDPQLATYTYTPSPPGSFTNCMLHHLWANSILEANGICVRSCSFHWSIGWDARIGSPPSIWPATKEQWRPSRMHRPLCVVDDVGIAITRLSLGPSLAFTLPSGHTRWLRGHCPRSSPLALLCLSAFRVGAW